VHFGRVEEFDRDQLISAHSNSKTVATLAIERALAAAADDDDD
jgi:hypothetical protein